MSETIRPININDEMRESFLSYAMSVITSRALPDVRDGMKPVQRRVLYAMHDMGMRPNSSFKKSARVVGEVLGKYHPHGDQAVYDAMVRMAQDFSLRYPLVDGQGNFGSIDGDSAAAMRYTETRMTPQGYEMMTDLEKDTVDFVTNYDDTLKQPTVLPATIPSLLVNGSVGIAVGMSTSIPPHNLGEVVDGLVYMLENWSKLDDITVGDLMQFIKGPDFPTGAMLFRHHDDTDMLTKAYASGRGRVRVRARATIEQIGRNKSRIIISELPYQVNKTSLLEKIANLHRDGKLDGLTDMRDESDRNGMRILIETTRTVDPEEILRKLYKYTPLESTFSIIMLALVNGEPKVLTLKQALRHYLDHRLEVVRRRTEYDLGKAQARAHIVEGLLTALKKLDDVVDIIRRSRTTETAHENLKKKLKLSDEQATAILNMQLRRLAALERRKLQDEHKELKKTIKGLEDLLASPRLMRVVIKDDLLGIREKYADARRTRIVEKARENVLTSADLVKDAKVWVVATEDGTLARTSDDRLLSIPGRPKEQPRLLLEANTKDILYTIAANGEAVSRYVYDLPKSDEIGTGVHWTDGNDFVPATYLAAAIAVPEDVIADENGGYLMLATVAGEVKRVRVNDLPGVSDQSFTLMRVSDGDMLGWVEWTGGTHEVLLATTDGQLIRFNEDDVRPSGLKAGGVGGIRLKSDEVGVIGMATVSPNEVAENDMLVWSIATNGNAKSTPLQEYPSQKRNGQGTVNFKLPRGVDEVVTMIVGNAKTDIYVKSKRNTCKRLKLGKAVSGKRMIRPKSINGLSIGDTNCVVGAVKASSSVAEQAEEMLQQLSLI